MSKLYVWLVHQRWEGIPEADPEGDPDGAVAEAWEIAIPSRSGVGGDICKQIDMDVIGWYYLLQKWVDGDRWVKKSIQGNQLNRATDQPNMWHLDDLLRNHTFLYLLP